MKTKVSAIYIGDQQNGDISAIHIVNTARRVFVIDKWVPIYKLRGFDQSIDVEQFLIDNNFQLEPVEEFHARVIGKIAAEGEVTNIEKLDGELPEREQRHAWKRNGKKVELDAAKVAAGKPKSKRALMDEAVLAILSGDKTKQAELKHLLEK